MMTDVEICMEPSTSCAAIDISALVPLLNAFKSQRSEREPNREFCFVDRFGNWIDFSHTVKSAWHKHVLSLVTIGKNGFVEIPGDGGRLFYVLQVSDRGTFVLSEVRIDLYQQNGLFVSQVHLDDLAPILEFIRHIPDDVTIPDDPDDYPHECLDYEQMFVSD